MYAFLMKGLSYSHYKRYSHDTSFLSRSHDARCVVSMQRMWNEAMKCSIEWSMGCRMVHAITNYFLLTIGFYRK